MARNYFTHSKASAGGNGRASSDPGERPEAGKSEPDAGAGASETLPLFPEEMEPAFFGESEINPTREEKKLRNAILYLRARARQGAQTPALKLLAELADSMLAERFGKHLWNPAHKRALRRQRKREKKAQQQTFLDLTDEGEKRENNAGGKGNAI